MIMFGGLEMERGLRPWLGKEVGDQAVARMLRNEYESFVIGEFFWGG